MRVKNFHVIVSSKQSECHFIVSADQMQSWYYHQFILQYDSVCAWFLYPQRVSVILKLRVAVKLILYGRKNQITNYLFLEFSWLPDHGSRSYRVFSHDVTAAILVSRKKNRRQQCCCPKAILWEWKCLWSKKNCSTYLKGFSKQKREWHILFLCEKPDMPICIHMNRHGSYIVSTLSID